MSIVKFIQTIWEKIRWWHYLIAAILAALGALVIVAILTPSPEPCFQPVGSLAWPTAPQGLGMGYLQVQVNSGSVSFPHVGVDVLAAPPEPVVAIETGTIVMDLGSDPDFALIVESASQPGTGWKYMHVSEASVDPLHYDQEFPAGTKIAEVVSYAYDVAYNHLHVEAVREYVGSGTPGAVYGDSWEDYESRDNPLAELTLPPDNEAPKFLVATATEYATQVTCSQAQPSEGWPFWFRKSEDSTTDPATYYCPYALSVGVPIDIVCRVRDLSSSGATLDLSPCCATTEVVHVADQTKETFELVFEGVPPAEDDFHLFVHDDVLQSAGYASQARRLYLIATNRPDSDGSWTPTKTGDYEITIEIRDAAGNAAERSMTVTVN